MMTCSVNSGFVGRGYIKPGYLEKIMKSFPGRINCIELKEGSIMEETHDDIIRKMNLPRVGQVVRSKKYGTLWRIIEKKEVWQNTSDDPEVGTPRMVPAIYLIYWKVKNGERQGIGKMLGYAYTLHDNTFEANWEPAEY